MSDLAKQLEAVLFMADGPLGQARITALLGVSSEELTKAAAELTTSLEGSGLRLSRHDDGWRLVTASEHGQLIRRLLEEQAKTELSRPALETLAIIAYRGPISRSGIEQLRGVGSDATIRGLLGRGLISSSGHAAEPGRPPLYRVSAQFLDLFGLSHSGELPPLGQEGTGAA